MQVRILPSGHVQKPPWNYTGAFPLCGPTEFLQHLNDTENWPVIVIQAHCYFAEIRDNSKLPIVQKD